MAIDLMTNCDEKRWSVVKDNRNSNEKLLLRENHERMSRCQADLVFNRDDTRCRL